MPSNGIRITKVTPLLSSLRDMVDDEVPCNQGSAATTDSLGKDILVVVTIVAI